MSAVGHPPFFGYVAIRRFSLAYLAMGLSGILGLHLLSLGHCHLEVNTTIHIKQKFQTDVALTWKATI